MKFKITYVTGLVEEVEQTDVDSIEGFINGKFGITPDEVHAHGTQIEILDESGEAAAVVEHESQSGETPTEASVPTSEDQPADPAAPAETAPVSSEVLGQTQETPAA